MLNSAYGPLSSNGGHQGAVTIKTYVGRYGTKLGRVYEKSKIQN